MTTAKCVSPSIGVFPTTLYQEIPSKTENLPIFLGRTSLFSDKTNDFSFPITVNSGEPLE